MTNITLDGLPPKTGTISDAGIIHYREGGVDKKMTVADFLIRISEEYSTDINTFLGAADKVAGRAALEIARRTAVSNADYTILVTDKVVAQIGTMSAVRIFSLPTAALYPAGEELIIVDQSGTVTSSNKITVSRASTDTIDGATSVDIVSAYGFLKLISDGISKWKISSSSIATTSVAGTVVIASSADIDTGSDTSKSFSPAAFLASRFGKFRRIARLTGSSSALLSQSLSTGKKYYFNFSGIVPANNAVFLTAQLSSNGGSTVLNSSYLQRKLFATTSDAAVNSTDKTTGFTICGRDADGNTGIGNTAVKGGWNGVLELFDPSNSGTHTQAYWHGTYPISTAFNYQGQIEGSGVHQSAVAINWIQFILKSVNSDTNNGNIASGYIDVWECE